MARPSAAMAGGGGAMASAIHRLPAERIHAADLGGVAAEQWRIRRLDL